MKNIILTLSKIRKMPKQPYQGDTIVEVMISMAVLAIVLVATYSFSNRAFQSGLNSQYRDQAVSYAQQQLELIREADNNAPQNIDDYLGPPYNTSFCINPSTKVRQPVASCTFNNLYNVTYTYDGSGSGTKVVKVVASWDSASGTKQQTVVYYKPNNTFTGTSQACTPASDPATCSSVKTDVPAIGISTDKIQINIGDKVIITWNSTNVDLSTCSASGPFGFGGVNVQSNNGTFTTSSLSPEGSYNFYVDCKDNAGTQVSPRGQATVTVVKPVPSNVATQAPNPLSYSSATLKGTVNPNGFATTYQFNFGLTSAYGAAGSPTPATSAGPGTSDVAASAAVTGLLTNTTYHFRLCATNAYGPTCSPDDTFKTAFLPAAPTVSNFTYSPSSYQTPGSSTLSWTIGGGPATSCDITGAFARSVSTAAGNNSFSVSPGAGFYTSTLTCTGPGGSSTQSTSLSVSDPPPPPPPPDCNDHGGYVSGGSESWTAGITGNNPCGVGIILCAVYYPWGSWAETHGEGDATFVSDSSGISGGSVQCQDIQGNWY
jgi:Tfp pilus assembly protein PilV